MPNPRAQRPLTLDRAVEDIKSFQVPARALADMMAGALRGSATATLGAPGDIESLGRGALSAVRAPSGQRLDAFISGMEQPTVMPTSERMSKMLPKATPEPTPFETLGQFAPLPGSAAAAKALSYGAGRAAGAGTRAVGQAISDAMIHQAGPLAKGPLAALAPRAAMTNVVKPKGGNWLTGSVEKTVEPLKQGLRNREYEALIRNNPDMPPERAQQLKESMQPSPQDQAINNWVERNLTNYIKKEMATPEDPVRKLAEQGIVHMPPEQMGYGSSQAEGVRKKLGTQQLGQSPEAQAWENATDVSMYKIPVSSIDKKPFIGKSNWEPWMEKADPNTELFYPTDSMHAHYLGFDHIIDVLKQDLASGRIRPEQLNKVSMEQAVRRTYEYDQEMAKKMAETQAKVTEGMPVHKEYPEGYKWIELTKPNTPLPEGYTIGGGNEKFVFDPSGKDVPHPNIKALEEALKYEGETMGHCVGGYCPDVLEGRSRIYSLRDAKGEPHVTIEVQPNQYTPRWESVKPYMDQAYEQVTKDRKARGLPMVDQYPNEIEMLVSQYAVQMAQKNSPPNIVQIKGKQNQAPKEQYLPYVQDFVKSGEWSDVGDLQNTGLIRRGNVFTPTEKQGLIDLGQDVPEYLTQEDIAQLRRARGDLPPEEGMATGGVPKPPDAEMREKLRQLRDSFVPLANEAERQKKIQDNLDKMNKKVSFSDNPDTMMMEVGEANMAGGGVAHYDKGGSIKATPRSEGWGMAADVAKAIEDASKEQFGYKNPATEVIADFLGIPAVARTLERKAYGEPITNIGKANVPLLPDDTAETLMTVAPLAKPAAKGAKAAGKLAASEIEKAMFGESSSKLLNEITPQVMAAAPSRLARAPAKTKEELRAVAERVAPQVTGEYVRKGPTKAETIAGKTQKQFEREKDLPVDIRPTGEARTPQKIDIESLKGSTFMGIPGDYTVTGKTLHGVGDVKLDMPSPQHGGPLYGLYHDDAHFWASEKDRAATAQNLARTISQQYESPVIGNYIMMGPEGMNYAQHFADANLQAIDLSKMSKRDIEKLNKAIREGSVESGRRESFPGIEDKGSAYLWFSQDPALRKHFNQIMQKESIAKLAGLPSGYDVRFAVTEPELRDLERGVTGFSMGQMRPDIPAEGLRFSEHPTYSHDIPGHFLGQSKYPIPYELSFPDTVKAIRENPRQAPHEFGTLQYIGARQPIDQQLIDEIKQYEEMMKSLTGKKKGGQVKKAAGGEITAEDLDIEERPL